MSRPRVGFIGLGIMGAPMAGHLAREGYPLTVHDIDQAKADVVAAGHDGVQVANTPRAVAEASDIVITMLPSGAYVRDVALGERGLMEGFQPGALLLDTSSSEPWLTVETAAALAARGVDMVDAPVSGARAGGGAHYRELTVFLGEVGIAGRLSDFGYRDDHIRTIVQGTLASVQARSNPRTPSEDDLAELVRRLI